MTITEQKRGLESCQSTILRPADFDTFWRKRLTVGPVDITTSPRPFVNPQAIYEELTLTAGDRTITARAIRPRGKGPFPTVLMFHDMGRRVRGWHHMTRFIGLGYAVIALDHGLDGSPRVEDYEWEQLETCYVNAVILIREAMTFSYVDPARVVAWGEGFGGGLAIVAAAMAGRAVRCAALNPMPADIRRVYGIPGGASASLPDYLDAAGFAPLLEGQMLLGTSLMDEVADVAGQYAIFHQVCCEKRHLVYPKYIHERINFFENELLKFMAW